MIWLWLVWWQPSVVQFSCSSVSSWFPLRWDSFQPTIFQLPLFWWEVRLLAKTWWLTICSWWFHYLQNWRRLWSCQFLLRQQREYLKGALGEVNPIFQAMTLSWKHCWNISTSTSLFFWLLDVRELAWLLLRSNISLHLLSNPESYFSSLILSLTPE